MIGSRAAVAGCLLAGVVSWFARPGPAHAEDSAAAVQPAPDADARGPVLVVFHGPAQPPATVGSARATLSAVARERGAVLLDVSPEPPAKPEAGLHLRRARDAYQSFDYERAHTEIRTVLDELARTGGAGLAADDLVDAHILAALVAGERGDADASWEHFVQAVVLEPSRRLDPVRHPPRVLDGFERAREAVAASPPASVRVDVARRCQVALDGHPVRPGDGVPAARGEHYLRVRCAGHADYGGRVLVVGERVTLRPALVAESAPATAELRALGEQRGARRVLGAAAVIAPQSAAAPGPTLTLTLVDVASESVRGQALASLAEDSAESRTQLRRAAARLLDGDVLGQGARPGARPAQPTPWYRRPWVWGVTGAAVGAAVLLPFALSRDDARGFSVQPGGELPR
ncbi:hypothetical protein [Haliangium ochraceum]|uniref:PEGA domain-containing protein n=1 Tax=Haliangium ochraceum (strain DSM 14365 / JCM 11303 / SMP-2) TaxID=502025 RepID=D0LUX1_HALO1|nr:hypothetical protein [Haliangium ochraceum]ACY14011.1 hypothetical protein Hoch_1458 [Haliangium ochraceum DSM 14365]